MAQENCVMHFSREWYANRFRQMLLQMQRQRTEEEEKKKNERKDDPKMKSCAVEW